MKATDPGQSVDGKGRLIHLRSADRREIRGLVRDLALDSPVEAGRLSNWTSAELEIVRSQHLAPWLYKALADKEDSGLPPEIGQQLLEQYRISAARAALRELWTGKLLAAFEENGIPAVLLKGAYLGEFVYKDSAQRPMADLDLLVPEDDREKAHVLLTALGCRMYVGGSDEFEPMISPSTTYVMDSYVPEYTDLHWGLCSMDYYRLHHSIIGDNVVESKLCGVKAYFLTPEANFVHIALHILAHSGGMRDWLDLILLSRMKDFHWDRLIELAESLGVVTPLHWVFRRLEKEWRFFPQPQVSTWLASNQPHWIEDRVIRGPFPQVWRWGSRFARLPDWGCRVNYLRARMVPPREYRQALCGSPNIVRYLLSRSIGLLRSALRP